MSVIVLTGMPATGKSTVCKVLTEEFGFPVVEKDAIKEQLFDTLGFTCYAEKRALDHAANAVVIHVVERILKAGGFALRIIDTALDGLARNDLAIPIKVIIALAKFLQRAVFESPLIIQNKLLAIICLKRGKSYLCVFHKTSKK